MHPNDNKKTIALPYRFGIEKIAQIFLSEFGGCQAIVSLFRNYGLSGIKMHSNFCIKIRVQIWLRELDLNQRPSGYENSIAHIIQYQNVSNCTQIRSFSSSIYKNCNMFFTPVDVSVDVYHEKNILEFLRFNHQNSPATFTYSFCGSTIAEHHASNSNKSSISTRTTFSRFARSCTAVVYPPLLNR